MSKAIRWALPLLLALVWCTGALAESAVPNSVTLNFQWMNPPIVTPEIQLTSPDRTAGVLQLPGKAQTAASYQWSLRYPVEASYSVLVLEYRARDLSAGGTHGDGVLQLEVNAGNGISSAIPVVAVGELVQDGAIYTLRKRLEGVTEGGSIDALRITVNSAMVTGRLDVHKLRLERPEGVTTDVAGARQTIQLEVRDATGLPMANADVRAGILEREEWTATGVTGPDGRVTLEAFAPTTIASTTAPAEGLETRPLEAVVLKDGYVSQYIAPISAGLEGAIAVRMEMTPPVAARSLTEPQQATAAGAAYQEPAATYDDYREPAYVYDHDYYDPWYYRRHYGYGFPYGFVWYVVVDDDKDRDKHHDARHHHRDGKDEWEKKFPGFRQRDWSRGLTAEEQQLRRLQPVGRPPREIPSRVADVREPRRPDAPPDAARSESRRGGQARSVGDAQVAGGRMGPGDGRTPDRRSVQGTPEPRRMSSPIRVDGREPGRRDRGTPGVITAPREAVVGAPSVGVVGAPRFGVISAPRTGVVTAPGTGVVSAPGTGVVSAPSVESVRAPSQNLEAAPIQAPVRSSRMSPGRGVGLNVGADSARPASAELPPRLEFRSEGPSRFSRSPDRRTEVAATPQPRTPTRMEAPSRFQSPSRMEAPARRFEAPRRIESAPRRFETPSRMESSVRRFESPRRMESSARRFESPGRMESASFSSRGAGGRSFSGGSSGHSWRGR